MIDGINSGAQAHKRRRVCREVTSPVDAHMSMSRDDAATILQKRFRGFSVRTMKPRGARLQVSAMDMEDIDFEATNDDDNDGEGEDKASAHSHSYTGSRAEHSLEEEGLDEEEEEEVEVVHARNKSRRRRMLSELESTLDGRYWQQVPTRRMKRRG